MEDDDRTRTSVPVYEDELPVLNEAKRTMAYERGEDLALHDVLVELARAYIDGGEPHQSWNIAELEDNLANVTHDGDPPAVTCPECDTFGMIRLSHAMDNGYITCERCSGTFGLLLVKQPEDD